MKHMPLLVLLATLLTPAAALADGTIQLQSVNYPDRFVRHRGFKGELTPLKPGVQLDKLDSSFVVRPGLAGQGVSFESVNFPGHFLRHQGFEIKLHRNDGSKLFKLDASFHKRGGLAGGTSFESVNYPGHFLRHCSFRMFIDNNKRGNKACAPADPVFRKDVSFNVRPVRSAIRLQSVNYPDRFVRHRGFKGELTPLAPGVQLDVLDSSFVVRPGLAGQGVSFESVNFPGHFLRHQGFEIKLHRNDGSKLFKLDASFHKRGGLAGGTSFESVNYPGHYLRHCSFRMFIDNNKRGNKACAPADPVFRKDVSFNVQDVR